MTGQPGILPDAWARQVRDTGSVTIGALTQPQIRVAGITGVEPGAGTGGRFLTSFERTPEADQQRATDAARLDGTDRDVAALAATVTAHPLFTGDWIETPAWFKPLSESILLTLSGLELPDGNIGVLETNIDLVNSGFEFTVNVLPEQARRLARRFFTPSPPAPEPAPDAEPGWNDPSSGGLAELSLVWPKGRGPRSARWRITRTVEGSPTAFVQIRKDHGMKRSSDDTVDEPQLAARLQEAFEQAAAQSLGR